ncbi:MAG: hypothetical protein GIW97_06295 [Candidatus Eremiobacteraeota bacterium]|nr:hypothetical protein [Candidatus Eremiobacteraeota bacterium]
MRFYVTFSAAVLAVSAIMVFPDGAIAQQRIFTPEPATPLYSYDYARGQDVQKLNGLFAKRIIEQTSDPGIRSCLRGAGKANVAVHSFDSGSVQMGSTSLGCLAPGVKGSQAIGSATATVNISAARLLALGLASDRFNAAVGFARNDRDLAHYDVEFFDDKDGNINIFFLVPPQKPASDVAGCPPTGLISTSYIIDYATFTARIGRMTC